MQSRRKFFGHIGVLIAASMAPSVFLPSNPVGWKRNVIYQPVRVKLKARWSPELVQDLMAYHNIDASAEMDALLMNAAEMEFPNNQIVKLEKDMSERIFSPSSFSIRYPVYATIMERV